MTRSNGAVRVVFTDVDGVLTDGGMYYGPEGEIMKRFDTRDGMGVARLRQIGIQTIIITTEDTAIAPARARKLGIERCLCGVQDKAEAVRRVCEELGIGADHCAFIGDDVNDIPAMQVVGFSAAPSDAQDAVRAVVDMVCSKPGGHGAFREFAEFLIRERSGA